MKKEKIFFWGDSRLGCQNDLLEEPAIHVANFECAVGSGSIKTEKAYNLSFSQEDLEASIGLYGYDILSLANNHTLDAGEDNFRFLENRLIEEGISVIGTRSYPCVERQLGDRTIRIVGAMEKAERYSKNLVDVLWVINRIQELKKGVDFLVLYIHWGYDSEYILCPQPSVIRLGRQLIEGGVDLVVGAHSHVPQPYEVHLGKYIYYSLGNASFQIEEGRDYLGGDNGVSVSLEAVGGALKTVARSFLIDEYGNVVEWGEKKLLQYCYPSPRVFALLFYFCASKIYIEKNSRAFLRRIQMFGWKHAVIFAAWLVYPKGIPFKLFYPLSYFWGADWMNRHFSLQNDGEKK